MKLRLPPTEVQPFYTASQLHGEPTPLPTGWEAATAYRQLLRALPAGRARSHAAANAVDAVIGRARSLLGHASRPVVTVEDGWPAPGELDLEATLEEPLHTDPSHLRIARVEPREVDLVLAIDMSLSMTGEKIALVAVAAAVLRLKVEHVGVVAFDTTARTLVHLGAPPPLRSLVRSVLEVPAQGYTNLEAGLATTRQALGRSRKREQVALLLTDGIGNVGWDPVPQAARLPRLHVVHLGRGHPQGLKTCARLARAGRGRLFRAPDYEHLPAVVREAVRRIFRAGRGAAA